MLKEEDFKGMELNPFAPFGRTPIFEHYRRLGTHKVFSNIPDRYSKNGWNKFNMSTLLKYVIVFIDRDSPLWEERDFAQRTRKALDVLNIKDDSLEYFEIEQEGELFQDFVFEFFKLINSHVYEQWFTTKMQVHTFNKYLRQAPDPKNLIKSINTKKALAKEIKQFSEDLVKLESNIFDDERLAKLISDKSTQNAIGGYAEKYADDPKWLHEQENQ
jgi:hypothetical protein